MKKLLVTLFASAFSLLTMTMVSAQQNLRSAYFLDGYTFKYKMNPAMAPERGFVALPVLSGTSAAVESNVGLSDFIFPTSGGGLTTFMNSSVSAQEFMNGLNDVNRINANVDLTMLAFGFRTGKAFHTVDLTLKGDAGVRLPKSIFSFMKEGSSTGNTSWDISGLGARVSTRLELGYGYSRPINDWINVGARLKFLIGVARADLLVDKLQLTASGTQWSAATQGKTEIAGPVDFGTNSSNMIDYAEIELPKDFSGYTSALSYGAAIDLGATFDILDYLTASVAVTDLGFISWKNGTTAEMTGGNWTYTGLGTFDTSNGIDLGDEFSDIGDELLEMVQMKRTGDNASFTRSLAATVHLGVEARMPFYERLSFGLLGTQKIDGPYSWTEGRLSANVAPVNWFSAAVTGAVSTFGSSFGGVINIHTTGFTLFAGLDSFLPLMNVATNYVPVGKMNTNFSFGIQVSFGKAVGRYRAEKKKSETEDDK